ncbi:MAG: hypothetical protein ABIU87_09875 [Ornithinibacter sp.]
MRGVGPGTVLGGRYTVHRRLEQGHDTERWSADDATLGRTVSVLCMAADDHRTPALLDAARRAASVTHSIFVRILDVGTDDEIAYVVEEDLDEARTLTQLVESGGVPGDEVRRITGEVASALDAASARGMHHLDLRPDDVLRTPDGDVRLRSLGTAAVRVGEDGAEADEASRRDAVGVVALAYAGLTGLWPLGGGGCGLGEAPRVPGGIAAPSEIAAGVPRDLDAICRLTLSDDQGPTSPGDYARQVAPWPSRQVLGPPVTRSAPLLPVDPGPGPVEGDPEPEPHRDDTTEAEPDQGEGSVEEVFEDDVDATRVLPVAGTDPQWASAGPGLLADDDAMNVRHVEAGDEMLEGTVLAHSQEADEPSRVTAAGAAVAGAGASLASALGSAGDRVGVMAKRAVDKVSEMSPDTRREESVDGLEAPAPLVPAEPLTKDESKVALAIVAFFLAFALIIGIWGVSRIGSNSNVGLSGDGSAPQTRTTTVAPSSSGAPASSSPGATASSSPEAGGIAGPIAVTSASAYDPQGDGSENDKDTPKIIDGDPSTGWNSENYRSDAFGGLKKGLGIVLDLGAEKTPKSVELVLPFASDLEVLVGPKAGLEGATKVGESKGKSGTVTIAIDKPVAGQFVVIWFTQLTADDRGKRRAWLNEATVTG